MHCCLECYIISLLYLKRINNTSKGIITRNSAKSLIIASFHFSFGLMTRMMLSQKYFDEICYKTKFYAQIADISESDMNFLEVEFLCTIHFSIAVFPYQYKVFYRELQAFSQQLRTHPLFLSYRRCIHSRHHQRRNRRLSCPEVRT